MKQIITLVLFTCIFTYAISQNSVRSLGQNSPKVIKEQIVDTKSTCNFNNPSNAFEDGYICNYGTNRIIANDFMVNAGEDYILTRIIANIFCSTTITNAHVYYYTDNGGEIGYQIGSQSVVPSSQEIVGANFGINVLEMVLDVDPFEFYGNESEPTIYWIGISTESSSVTYWENTSATTVNHSFRYFDGNQWLIPYPERDGVYTFVGNCLPTCSKYNVIDYFEDGYLCGVNAAYGVANDFQLEENDVFVLEEITARFWTFYPIVNADIIYYNDNGGLPGDSIGGELNVVPLSQDSVGEANGYTMREAIFSVPGFTFEGPGTYWVRLKVEDEAGGNIYWSVTSYSAYGYPFALISNETTWSIYNPIYDGIYVFSGDCSSTSINEITETINLYPNPSNGNFKIELAGKALMEIFDISGKLIDSQNINGSIEIHISNPGLYFVKLTNDSGSTVQKVIVQ